MPLASDLGVAPMMLDLDVGYISGVPITGIASVGAVSDWQFFLGNREFVRLSRLDYEFSAISIPDLA
jgi:hypothetical protein